MLLPHTTVPAKKQLPTLNLAELDAIPVGPPESLIPGRATLDLTHVCNFRCHGCIEQSAMQYSGRSSLSRKTILRLIEQCKSIGIEELDFYGSESRRVRTFRTRLPRQRSFGKSES